MTKTKIKRSALATLGAVMMTAGVAVQPAASEPMLDVPDLPVGDGGGGKRDGGTGGEDLSVTDKLLRAFDLIGV